MRFRGLSTLLLLSWGCGESVEYVPLPDLAGLTTIVAQQVEDTGAWTTSVYGGEPGWRAELSSADVVYLLGYEASAEALGLLEGGTPACRLRRPDRVEALVEVDGGWRWSEVAAAPTGLLDELVGGPGRCDPCATPRMRTVTAPHTYRYRGVAWMEDGSLLAVHQQGYSRVLSDRIEVLPLCPGGPNQPVSLAGLGGDRFLLGGADGELVRARFSEEGRVCEVETATATARGGLSSSARGFDEIAANPDDPSAFDYYALRNTGELYHWTAAGLRRVGANQFHPDLTEALPASLLRLDAHRLVTSVGWKELSFWEDDQLVRTERLDLPKSGVSNTPRDRITLVKVDERSQRFLVGTAIGEVWSRDMNGGPWSVVFRSPVLESVGGIVALSDRYLITQDGGDAASWDFGGGVCETTFRIPLSSNGSSCRLIARMGTRIALADAIGSSATFAGVVWVEP